MKRIKTFNKLFENESIIQNNPEVFDIVERTKWASGGDLKLDIYSENRDVDGFEIDDYTDGGVNIIIFIDLRDVEISYENYVKEFKSYVSDFDIGERIDMYRQDQLYKNNFTIEESVNDFKAYKEKLEEFVSKL